MYYARKRRKNFFLFQDVIDIFMFLILLEIDHWRYILDKKVYEIDSRVWLKTPPALTFRIKEN